MMRPTLKDGFAMNPRYNLRMNGSSSHIQIDFVEHLLEELGYEFDRVDTRLRYRTSVRAGVYVVYIFIPSDTDTTALLALPEFALPISRRDEAAVLLARMNWGMLHG